MFKTSRTRRCGQSLVEFALVTPLFFLLIFGIIEGGRLVWTHHTMTNATREGARYATVRGSGSTQTDAPASSASIRAHMLAVSTGLAASDLNVNMVLLDGDMGDKSRFRIESSYEYEFIITSMFGLDSITLHSSSSDMFWKNPGD